MKLVFMVRPKTGTGK